MRQKKRLKRLVVSAIGIVIIAGLTVYWTAGTSEDFDVAAIMAPAAAIPADPYMQKQDGEDYADYLAKHEDAVFPEHEIVIEAADFHTAEGDGFAKLEGFAGDSGVSLKTGEQGLVEWRVEVPETGWYNLSALYYPIAGKSASIERSLLLDGEVPFNEAAHLKFDRIWVNASKKVKRDNRGNDLRPQQVEQPEWRETLLKDSDGYYEDPFRFYLTAGTHSLSFVSSHEPMVVRRLKLVPYKEPAAYKETLQQYLAEGLKETKDWLLTIQGEDAVKKSSPTLYPQAERSSSAVTPYSPKLIRVNSIGGYNWRMPGDWIEWEVDVPETGLYKIGMKAKQNFVRGIYSTRRLLINGEVPFKEANRIPFRFKSGYRIDVIGGDQPYLFKLQKGKNVIRLENSLGGFAPLIREVKDSLYTLNAMYRKIVMITGTAPDPYRDYRVDKLVPHLIETFQAESERLKAISNELHRLSGGSSDSEALLKTMAVQLDDMIKDPDTIPRRLTAYKINTGGLGTWLQRTLEMPLQIDEIYVAAPNQKFPPAGSGFLAGLKHEMLTFAWSFFIDYNQIGNVADKNDQRSISVWIGSGRDQANTLKALIDESFTPDSGINVNLKLVQMNTLLPATLAGQGPDVAMQIGSDIPVNFGMRHAAYNLSKFSDYQEVAQRFRPSALVPYTYENGIYALPETQTFNMLFYRQDVLSELGLQVPQTWDDVHNLLAVLNKNHMQFGLPFTFIPTYPGQNIPPNPVYATLLLQNGGQFYRDGGKESDLDSRIGVETFKIWTEFYTDYKLEREFDFANRFRTGEMPIGIADYTLYNQLTVFAPEIRGMWAFAPMPGTKQPDGAIRRDTPGGGSAVMMLASAKDKDAAWEFMKWWTSDETQIAFGREMEALMGAAARYPTANTKALDSLPWPITDYENLKAEFIWVRGIPEVPGGYFTGRHLQNAFYKVVVDKKAEPRDAILDYTQYIQDEIKTKRKEFGLPD
ncbi:MAG TPA: extracellular solute-binding protein [Bacilli bacterium]